MEKKKTEISGVFLSRISKLKKIVLFSLVKHFGVAVRSLSKITIPFESKNQITVSCFADEDEEYKKLLNERLKIDFIIIFFRFSDASKTFFESYIDRFLGRHPNTPVVLFSIKDKHTDTTIENLIYAKRRIDNRRVLPSNYVSKRLSDDISDDRESGEVPLIEDLLFFNHIRTAFHFFLQFKNSYGPISSNESRNIKPSLAPFKMPASQPEFLKINAECSKKIKSLMAVIEGWEKQIEVIFGEGEENHEKGVIGRTLAEMKQNLDDILLSPDDSIEDVIEKMYSKWKKFETKLILKRYLKMKLFVDYTYRDSFLEIRSEWFAKLLKFLVVYGMDGNHSSLFLAQCSIEQLLECKEKFKQKTEIHLFEKSGKVVNIHLITSLVKDYFMNYPRQPFIKNFATLRSVKLRAKDSQKFEETIKRVRALLFEKLNYHQYLLLRDFLPFLLNLSQKVELGSNVDNLSSHFCTIFLFRPEEFRPTEGDEENFRIVFNQTMGDAQRVMKYLIVHSKDILMGFTKLEFSRLRSVAQRKRKEEMEIERINWNTVKFYFLHKYWESVVGRREIGIRKYLFQDLRGSLEKIPKSLKVEPKDVKTFRKESQSLEEDPFYEKLSELFSRQRNFWEGSGSGMAEFNELFDRFRKDVVNVRVRNDIKKMIRKIRKQIVSHREKCVTNKNEFEKSSKELISQYRATYRVFVERSVEMKKFKYLLLFDEDDEVESLDEEKKKKKNQEFQRLKTGVEKLALRLKKIEAFFSKKYYECYQIDIANYLQKVRNEVDEKIRQELPRIRSNEFIKNYQQIVCPLTFSKRKQKKRMVKKIMKDPVILVDSGITYERDSILRYLNSGNQLDPISKRVVLTKKLVPNLMMKQFIDSL